MDGAGTGSTYRIGVDIGGTFTDVVVAGGDGAITRAKAFTTRDDYAEGVIAAVQNAADELGRPSRRLLADCASFVNATTVVTNAIAEERGRRVGLLVTKGFGQQLYLHRGVRQLELDLQKDLRPPDLVPPRRIAEISERIDRYGDVIAPLDAAEVERECRRLVEVERVDALAICFLWSFRNQAHEREAEEIVRALFPGLFVTSSCEICPRIREYERMNTAVLNSFVSEGAETYVSSLICNLEARGLDPGRVAFMQSLGGRISEADLAKQPIQLSHSGPVGGVVAAGHFAKELGLSNVITADLGGTSFDTALIREGRLERTQRVRINRLLTGLSTVDIHAIGSGGGSIGWIDGRGLPQVGPRSAGSDPGPACYGRLGTEPTITDANLVLGLIDPENFWGGAVKLDVAAAEAALQPLAEQLELSLLDTAAGLHEIAVTQMSTAIATVSIGRGFDPRDFTAFGYGGAAGLFLAEVCGQIGIRRLFMPRAAATFSAYGLLFADAIRSLATTVEWNPATGSLDAINNAYRLLERQAIAALEPEGFCAADISIRHEADVKWVGQSFELKLTISGEPFTEADRERLTNMFVREYEQVYGRGTAWEGFPIELHTARVVAVGETVKPPLARSREGPADPASALTGSRLIHLGDGVGEAGVYRGPGLRAGMCLSGPALVDDVDTTLYVPENVSMRIDALDNYVFETGG